MGCSSELGCLGPRPRAREVYLDLLESIYHEIEEMVIPMYEEQDSYELIKSKLAKKGLLRKLIDNLKSHKSNIYECVNQNFQISSQSNMSQTRVGSLIIVDNIMEDLLKLHKNIQESSLNEKGTPEIHMMLSKPNSSMASLNTWDYSDFREFDQRIDTIFFKQITFLLESEKKLEDRIIQSIILFCHHRQDKTNIKAEIYILLDFLYRKMHRKQDPSASSFRAFQLLLNRLKDNLKQEEKDMKYIKFFINTATNRQGVEKGHLETCEQILKIYFSKYFSDYLILYKPFLQLLDELNFEGSQVWSIWDLMVKIAKEVDNYNNFVRGIFIFLLRYIMVNQNLSSHSKLTYKLDEFSTKVYKNMWKEECKLNAFKMITQWIVQKYIDIDESIVYSSALIVMTYISNYVLAGSDAIKQSLKKQFYKIISLLSVKSNEVIVQLLIEQLKDRQTPNKKRQMLLVVIKEIVVLKNMLANAQSLQNYNIIIMVQPYYSLEIKLEIINYCKFVVKSIKSEYVNGASYDAPQLRQRLCDLLCSIYACIVSERQLHEETEAYIQTNLYRKSKNVDDLSEAKAAIIELNKFASQLNSIIRILLDQHFYIIVVGFVENVNNAMVNLCETATQEQTYILIYFVELIKRHALFSISKREKIPEDMLKLHLKLEEGHISVSIRNEMVCLAQSFIKQCISQYFHEEHSTYQTGVDLKAQISIIIKSDQKRITAAKQFYMFNQMEYGQVMQAFRHHFPSSTKSTFKKDTGDSMSEAKNFHRHSSVNLSRQEFQRQRQSIKNETDESFRDILAKINQR